MATRATRVSRTHRTSSGLLTYARVGTQPLRLQAIEANQVVDEVLADLATAITVPRPSKCQPDRANVAGGNLGLPAVPPGKRLAPLVALCTRVKEWSAD